MSSPINPDENETSQQFQNTHHDLVKVHEKYVAIVHQEESDRSDFPPCHLDNHLMYELHHRDISHLAEDRACCPNHAFESIWETIKQHESRLRTTKVEADIYTNIGQEQRQAPAGPGEIPVPEGWRRANTRNRNNFQRKSEEGYESSVWLEGARNWHYVQTDGWQRVLAASHGKPKKKTIPTSSMESAIKICDDATRA